MKLRMGFVSNSSSSSFVIAAVQASPEVMKKYDHMVENEIELNDGETHRESTWNGDEFTLNKAGKYYIVASHQDEECDDWGDCDFTEELHEEIYELFDNPEIDVIKSMRGYGRNG